MPVAGPFYLAMVDETETTFNSGHHRMDEYVFSATRTLAEGEKPKLVLVIENPRVGLLSPLRKQWCWFAWDSNWGGTPNIIPLFFGRIVGIPSDLQAETITVTFVSWPTNYKKQLQTVAEILKVLPFYDPVFTDISQRDDPMAIFESQSKLVCVDPVTLTVSASDILNAEDGNVDFTEDDHFYNSLHVAPGAVPKSAIHVDASVSWTQNARGYVDMGNHLFNSYSGDGILNEWPKPLTSIAPGLSVFTSLAADVNNIASTFTVSGSSSWTNKEKVHEDGDSLSFSSNWSTPAIHGTFRSRVITANNQPGFLDPFAVDVNGDPSPTNIPMSINETTAYVPLWTISTSMVLEYQAARQHTERVIFNLFADVQPTMFDTTVSEDSETLNISGADVGVPIVELLNWNTVSGTFVAVGTVVFPDDPHLPGNNTAQIVEVAGTIGIVEPNFSPVAGDTTPDGTATWASLGVATPTDNAPDWTGASHVPTGSMILPRRPLFTTYENFVAAGLTQFPPIGTPISEGTILQLANGTFKVCTTSGTIAGPVADTAVLTPLSSLPDGKTYFIAKVGGTTGAQYVIPNFNTTLYAPTTDGTVTWVAIARGEIPVGGTPGDVTGSTYFSIDRGRQSLQHLICRARARLRYASRCITTQFQCSYLRGTALSLRKSATLHDYRLPGGLILGKITGVEMTANSGAFSCNVTIQSSIGLDTVVTEVLGTPTYVAGGYVDDYQVYDGQVILLPEISDVGFSPLVPVPDEDGITFPLQKSMIIVSEGFKGTSQEDVIDIGFDAMVKAANPGSLGFSFNRLGEEERQRELALLQSNTVSEQLKAHPNWYELVLKPLNGNGSFNHVYHLTCTTLSLPKMIDLAEESTS